MVDSGDDCDGVDGEGDSERWCSWWKWIRMIVIMMIVNSNDCNDDDSEYGCLCW